MLILSVTGLLITSCYKKFDPASYAPLFTINGFSSVNQIKHGNLVGYWAFEGSLSDSVSGTAGVNHGTAFSNGFIGSGIALKVASTSYITMSPTSAQSGVQSFTISFWVNPTFVDANNDGGIDGILGFVGLSNPANFWGNIEWWVENGSNPSASEIKVHIASGAKEIFLDQKGIPGVFGKWSNHTLTYDASTSKFIYYINGSVVMPATPAPWTGPLAFANSGPFIIGCAQFQATPSLTTATGSQPWASYLTGTFDELRIYNAVLTAAEVNSLVVLQGKSSNH